MNRRMVFYMLGQIVRIEAALLALPLVVSLIYGEYTTLWAFLIAAGVALVGGTLLTLISRPGNQMIFAKEGFVIVALAWLLVSAVGALPFTISGGISYTDAFFETVSGFTTTGSSILTDVESLSHGLLFWRSFTHWVGGMGVLVLVMAIVPSQSGRTMHILRAEMPGPIIGKLVPRVRDTAKILYYIYLGMTAVLFLLLVCGGMSVFDSLLHAFGTAGTGGFGIKADSVASYSPYLQWVIAVGMLVFGINFNLYYLILIRRFRTAFKSGELWCYLIIVLVATGIITANTWHLYETVEETIRTAFFQVSSITTTTGFATTDYGTLWPGLSKAVLFLLTFMGGCAGSTAGGFKVSRVMLLVKSVRRDLRQHLHHRAVGVVKLEGKRVDEATVHGTGVYLALYLLIFVAAFLVVSADPFGLETNISAVATCLNNVGPGFGAVGPAGNFAGYSDLSTWVLSFTMLFGRLELFPLLFALTPSTWTKK